MSVCVRYIYIYSLSPFIRYMYMYALWIGNEYKREIYISVLFIFAMCSRPAIYNFRLYLNFIN